MVLIAVSHGRGMRVMGRIGVSTVLDMHCIGGASGFGAVVVCREFRFLSVGLRYHLVEVPLNPIIRPRGPENRSQPGLARLRKIWIVPN